METTYQFQCAYKESRKVNSIGDGLAADLSRVEDTVLTNRLDSFLGGRTEFLRVAEIKTSTRIRLDGVSWKEYDWTGAHVLVTTGISAGSSCTISNISPENEYIELSTALSLATLDILRIEHVLDSLIGIEE